MQVARPAKQKSGRRKDKFIVLISKFKKLNVTQYTGHPIGQPVT
jgi:hypothetical protein